LILHQKNAFHVTAEGKLLLKHAKPIFESLVSLEHQIKNSAQEISGDLILGSSQSISIHLISEIFAKIKKISPKVHPILKLGKTETIKDWVADGVIEIGLAIDKGGAQGLTIDTIHKGNFITIRSKSHSKLIAEPQFIVTETRNEVSELQKLYQLRFKKPAPIIMTVDSWNVICSFVSCGLGYGLVPDFMLTTHSNLERFDKIPYIEYKLCAYYKSPKLLSRPAQQFLQFAKEKRDR